MKKKENIIMGVGLLLLIVSIVGVSYAAFSYTGSGSKINTITTGVLSMSYTESDNVISMDKALPTTDDTGKVRLRDGEYFDFTVESTITGNAIINYEVAAEALSSNTFDGKNVKLYLTKINGTTEEEIMLPKLYMPRTTANTKTGRPSGMVSLTTGSMGTSETIKYRLRMYVKEGYNPQDDNGNEVFQVKINVYGKVAEEVTGTLIKAYDGVFNPIYPVEPTSLDDNVDEALEGDFHNYREHITSIVTKDNNIIPETAIDSWDISEAGDGKAVAYVEGEGPFILTLGGEGGLIANPNMYAYFYGFSAKTIDLTYLDTSMVTDMTEMFAGSSSLVSVNISNFDTSNTIYMGGMFDWCSSLMTLDVSNFDTSKVTNMGGMFSSCKVLSSLDLSNFDTSNTIYMSWMFGFCRGISTLDLSNFDTSNVIYAFGMFRSCDILESLNLDNFDTSKVVDMSSMFDCCYRLATIDLNHFDTSNATDMSNMFNGCTDLSQLDLSNFDTSNATDMSNMFNGCRTLTSLDLSGFDTSNVIDMSWMFEHCTSLTSLNISNFDTSSVTYMSYMFYGCESLTSLDLTSFDISNVKAMNNMFSCSDLTLIKVSNKWVISADTNANNMFLSCATDHVTYV